jgi:hypothetical protein
MPEAIVANDDLCSFEKSPSRRLPMSGTGTKRTWWPSGAMSGVGARPDEKQAPFDFRK